MYLAKRDVISHISIHPESRCFREAFFSLSRPRREHSAEGLQSIIPQSNTKRIYESSLGGVWKMIGSTPDILCLAMECVYKISHQLCETAFEGRFHFTGRPPTRKTTQM